MADEKDNDVILTTTIREIDGRPPTLMDAFTALQEKAERLEVADQIRQLQIERDEARAMLARVRKWAEDTSTHMDECFGRGYSKARESIRMMINKVRG